MIAPARTTVILSWAILRASGVPGSAAGHGSRVPRQREREPTKTVKGIRLQFQQVPPAINSSQQQTDFKEILPPRDVTCLNAVSFREKDTFPWNSKIRTSVVLFLRDGLFVNAKNKMGSLHFPGEIAIVFALVSWCRRSLLSFPSSLLHLCGCSLYESPS